MSKKAALLMADGTEEIEATVPYDLLTRAGIQVDLVSVDNKTSVKGNMGMVWCDLIPMKDYDFSSADALILPGGDGYVRFQDNPQVIELIRQFDRDSEKTLGAICAAASIPGKLGLYKDKNYTCVPGLNGDFGGHYQDVHAVVDGNVVTGISVGGAFEFAFDLIARLVSAEKAQELEKATCWKL